MPISFEPRRRMPRDKESGLVVTRRSQSGQTYVGLELRLSQDTQERLKYLHGDRCVVHFDEEADSLRIERVAGDKHGYKIVLGQRADGRPVAYVKLTCTPEEASQVLGEQPAKAYELVEVNGHQVTFLGA